MVRQITTYPTTPSLEFGANVRKFDQSLDELIDDLKDTITANNLSGLAAFQIGSPLNVIVIKQENGEFLELINPRMIKKEGQIAPIETTAYFPGLSAKTKRYKKITIMYEDKNEQQKFLSAEDDLSVLLQRKLDYMFGANFRVRLDEREKALLDSKLQFGTDAITDNGCPTVFKRDKILNTFKYIFAGSLILAFFKFFLSNHMAHLLGILEGYSSAILFILLIIYFFYAQYEGKQYKNCSSCQIGNIIGTTAISLAKLLILLVINYLLLW